MIEDVVVGFEDAVREPIVAHELPDVLDRIERGRFRRQRQERDVVGDGKPLRDMPSRLIKNKDGVRAGATASEISPRCRAMASLLQEGSTSPAPFPSAGQMAPKI